MILRYSRFYEERYLVFCTIPSATKTADRNTAVETAYPTRVHCIATVNTVAAASSPVIIRAYRR